MASQTQQQGSEGEHLSPPGASEAKHRETIKDPSPLPEGLDLAELKRVARDEIARVIFDGDPPDRWCSAGQHERWQSAQYSADDVLATPALSSLLHRVETAERERDEAKADRNAHAEHVRRMAAECEDGLAALEHIDACWEAFGVPSNRGHLSLAEQISATNNELDAAQATITSLQAQLARAREVEKQANNDADMYARAWQRELGHWMPNKRHHIDACVVGTRRLVEGANKAAAYVKAVETWRTDAANARTLGVAEPSLEEYLARASEVFTSLAKPPVYRQGAGDDEGPYQPSRTAPK